MEMLEKLLLQLQEKTEKTTALLQQINAFLLTRCRLVTEELLLRPLDVEIFYINMQSVPPYVDTNMQCMGEDGVDERIWSLQSGRFGQFYCHLKGSGGVDVCLSHHASYALCCTLRAAIINGEEVWGRQKVCHVLCNLLAKGASSKEEAASAVNSACVTLQPCQDVEDGCVYHIRRKLRRVGQKVLIAITLVC